MTTKGTPASVQRLLGRLARTASEALLARLFGVLGLLDRWRPPAHGRRPAPQRILLLRFGLLGDAVLWIPALRAARRLFPTAHLEAVVSGYQYAVLSRFTYVDRFIVQDTDHFTRPAAWLRPTTWRSFAALVRRLRRRRYDLVLSCYGRMGARLALLSGAPLRYGYRDEADPLVLTHALPGGRYQEPLHEAAYNVRVVSAAASAAQHGSTADDLSLTFPLTARRTPARRRPARRRAARGTARRHPSWGGKWRRQALAPRALGTRCRRIGRRGGADRAPGQRG